MIPAPNNMAGSREDGHLLHLEHDIPGLSRQKLHSGNISD